METSLHGPLAEGFSKLTREERFQRLFAMGALSAEEIRYFKEGGLKNLDLADCLIENSVGYFQLPLGVATNFCIDGQDYVIPMAVEETSIIAALSKTAKWIRQQGHIRTWIEGRAILGQIQLAAVEDVPRFLEIIALHRIALIDRVNQDVTSSMVKRGGGVLDLICRTLLRPDGRTMVVIHVTMDPCDAMGANMMNQVLEYLKGPIESLTGETVHLCILSNLNDQKITHATVTLHHVPEDLGKRLEEASLFANLDPYRAATHNKGVMNGIDPVLIATGNDWRAVEAGIHAYATRHGRYEAITRWRYAPVERILTGHFEAPLVVGTVGGVTALHPSAKICLKMMKITRAEVLSRVIAAVGLVQNLGAIRALCTDGIIQGHMRLHIDNLVLNAGAVDHEIPVLKERLKQFLRLQGRVTLSKTMELLTELRQDSQVI